MRPLVSASDAIYWYLSELTSRIVAETGIPSDRYHLGKIILQSLKDAPDFILQIDAATGKSENFKSALERSVRCALSLKKMGLKYGDVIAIIAPHYLEMAILYYAALYLGIKIAIMDPSFELLEVKEMLQINRANIIFSQNRKIPVVKEAIKLIDLKAKIVSFDDESNLISFAKFMEECGDVDIYAFKPTDFDPEVTIATLVPSSGTTDLPKIVASTHKNYLSAAPCFWANAGKLPTPFERYFLTSPVIWVSAVISHLLASIIRFTKIQSSAGFSVEHYIDIINKYRPESTAISPAALFSFIKPGLTKKADLTCFSIISVGGSEVPEKLFNELKKATPRSLFLNTYGATEFNGVVFHSPYGAPGSLGRPTACYDIRLVDPETLKDITEPHVNGELWVRGPAVAQNYYNNPSETKPAFVDGWFRSGDIFYRDEQYSFYYVDRLKLLLKYRTYVVSPAESEKVIREHPGVLDVVVVGIPDLECGDLPAACIIPNSDNPPTAQEIKDFVKEKLSDAKQLRGGVIFLDQFPFTFTTKVDRKKLKEIAIASKRE